MLPNVDGMKILQTLRATGDQTPVLMLSALGSIEDKVAGLRAGGDDYVTKHFAISELVARLEVLKRRGPAEKSVSELGVSDLVMDLAAHQVRKGGVPVDPPSPACRGSENLWGKT